MDCSFFYNCLMIKVLSIVFIVSMLPLIELRGAIPVGVSMLSGLFGLEEGQSLNVQYIIYIIITAMLGNMLPVPFIFLFARKFLEWGQNKKFIGGICRFFLEKGHKAGDKLKQKAGRGLFVALLLFVGIPLPGTGAWTGTLAASLLDMNMKETIFSVLCGVLLAAILMTLASCGLLGAAGALFVK